MKFNTGCGILPPIVYWKLGKLGYLSVGNVCAKKGEAIQFVKQANWNEGESTSS